MKQRMSTPNEVNTTTYHNGCTGVNKELYCGIAIVDSDASRTRKAR